jgi:hypothetical protein
MEVKKRFDASGVKLAYPRRQIVIDPKARYFSSESRIDIKDPRMNGETGYGLGGNESPKL